MTTLHIRTGHAARMKGSCHTSTAEPNDVNMSHMLRTWVCVTVQLHVHLVLCSRTVTWLILTSSGSTRKAYHLRATCRPQCAYAPVSDFGLCSRRKWYDLRASSQFVISFTGSYWHHWAVLTLGSAVDVSDITYVHHHSSTAEPKVNTAQWCQQDKWWWHIIIRLQSPT